MKRARNLRSIPSYNDVDEWSSWPFVKRTASIYIYTIPTELHSYCQCLHVIATFQKLVQTICHKSVSLFPVYTPPVDNSLLHTARQHHTPNYRHNSNVVISNKILGTLPHHIYQPHILWIPSGVRCGVHARNLLVAHKTLENSVARLLYIEKYCWLNGGRRFILPLQSRLTAVCCMGCVERSNDWDSVKGITWLWNAWIYGCCGDISPLTDS